MSRSDQLNGKSLRLLSSILKTGRIILVALILLWIHLEAVWTNLFYQVTSPWWLGRDFTRIGSFDVETYHFSVLKSLAGRILNLPEQLWGTPFKMSLFFNPWIIKINNSVLISWTIIFYVYYKWIFKTFTFRTSMVFNELIFHIPVFIC